MDNSHRHDDLLAGLKNGVLLGAAVLALALPPAHLPPAQAAARATAAAPAAPRVVRTADLGGEPASEAVHRIAEWVARSGDNAGLPFAILDKRNAHLFLFRPDARLQAATPVLLGSAPGDLSVPGIGSKPIEAVKPSERTTPAGRFLARTGRNMVPEDVVWVDYDAAVSMHRVRTTNAHERRLERLASPSIEDNRISYGCINLPVAFFEQQLWPAFRQGQGVVYVLPEQLPLQQVFAQAFQAEDTLQAVR